MEDNIEEGIACLATRPGTDIHFELSRCDWQQNSNPVCSYAARTHLFLRAHSKASRNCSQRIPIERGCGADFSTDFRVPANSDGTIREKRNIRPKILATCFPPFHPRHKQSLGKTSLLLLGAKILAPSHVNCSRQNRKNF